MRPRETYPVPLKTVGQYTGTASTGGVVIDLVTVGAIDPLKGRADTITIQNMDPTALMELYLTDDLLSGLYPWTMFGTQIMSFHVEGTKLALKGVAGPVDFQILVLERF